jgi:flotillin
MLTLYLGEAEKEGESKQKIAKIDAQTAVLATERKIEKANADANYKKREIEIGREINLEQIAAQRSAEERDAELQRGVEEKRAHMELERLRATTVVQAKIARESAQEKADADLYSSNKKADAQQYNQNAEADAVYNRGARDAEAALYKRTKDAEARERDAEATYYTKAKEAEATFLAQKKEAEGLLEMAKAYGALANVMGGPQGLMQYLMLQNNTFERLAEQNAKAIHGLQPKINVWNTGNQEGVDSTAPIRNLFQSLPPLLSTISDQTGMQPPSWLAQMPPVTQNGEMTPDEKMQRKKMLNGAK